MDYHNADLVRCKKLIEQKLDWGTPENWTSTDFENLQNRILEETGVSLSTSTLRRVWGRVDYQHLPSETTLKTLARFAGYADWRTLVRSVTVESKMETPETPLPAEAVTNGVNWRKLGWIVGVTVVIALLGIVAFQQKHRQPDAAPYRFSSKALTQGIPNSVIFTYDASAATTDSVFIQQSWDANMRSLVSKDGSTHTSIYYEPGFYIAKLIVGNEVVREHSLLIPTNGWLGTIDAKPIPLYLKPDEFVAKGILQLPIGKIQDKNIPLQPKLPLIKYTNVGNFGQLPITGFSFSSDVKNEFSEGTAACQLAWIVLITTDMPIVVPLSTKGCVSELSIMDGSRMISGKKTDLSAFGVDFADWVHVGCRSDGQKIYFLINGKVALTSPLPVKKISIVGISFAFQGTGAVKNVSLSSGNKLVFQDFSAPTVNQ